MQKEKVFFIGMFSNLGIFYRGNFSNLSIFYPFYLVI
jgi:hypothetical protein